MWIRYGQLGVRQGEAFQNTNFCKNDSEKRERLTARQASRPNGSPRRFVLEKQRRAVWAARLASRQTVSFFGPIFEPICALKSFPSPNPPLPVPEPQPPPGHTSTFELQLSTPQPTGTHPSMQLTLGTFLCPSHTESFGPPRALQLQIPSGKPPAPETHRLLVNTLRPQPSELFNLASPGRNCG